MAAGYDGDFTLVDMKRQRRIEESWIVSPCGWTPFAGMQVTGWPVATIVRGRIVMRDDEVLGEPCGKLVNCRVSPESLIQSCKVPGCMVADCGMVSGPGSWHSAPGRKQCAANQRETP